MAEVTKRVAQIFIEDGQADVTLKGLIGKARLLRNELGRMTIGSPEFKAKLKDLQAVEGDLKRITAEVRNTNGVWNQMKNTLGPLRGLMAGVFAGGSIVSAIKSSIASWREHEVAITKVGTALKNTGGTAGVTMGQLEEAADRLQKTSLFSDEDILQKASAQLISFGNIAGDNLMRAQQASVDLSTVMNNDLQGAAMAVGKALNSPVEGLQGLQRIGVRFSADQKAVIKDLMDTGKVAEAQGVILGELEKRYRGQAAAVSDVEGGYRKWSVAVDELGEGIGSKLSPIVSDLLGGLADLVDGVAEFLGLSSKASEKLEEQRIEMNALFNVMKSGNITQEQRSQLIGQINTQYADYLPNLLDESSSLEDITKAQQAANRAMLEKIEILAKQEILQEALDEWKEAEKELFNLQVQQQKWNQGVRNMDFTQLHADLKSQSALVDQLASNYNNLVGMIGNVGNAQQGLGGSPTGGGDDTGAVAERLKKLRQTILDDRAALALSRKEGMAKEIAEVNDHYDKLVIENMEFAEEVAQLEDLRGARIREIRKKYADQELQALAKLDQQIAEMRAEGEKGQGAKDAAEMQRIRDKYAALIEANAAYGERVVRLEELRDMELERKAQEQAEARQVAADELTQRAEDAQVENVTNELAILDAKHERELEAMEQQGGNIAELMVRQAEERAALQAELDQAAVDAVNRKFEDLYALYDAAGTSTVDLQRIHGDALALLRQQQGEAEVAATTDKNKRLLDSDKRIADARRKVSEDLFDASLSLLATAAENEGSWADFMRVVTLGKIVYDTASAISSLEAMSEANPANAFTFGGAGTAQFAAGLIRILANMGQAASLLNRPQPKAPAFAEGGGTGGTYTFAKGIGMAEEDGGNWWDEILGRRVEAREQFPDVSRGGRINKPTLGYFGEAGPEWVAPNWMYAHPTLQPVFEHLEKIRTQKQVAFADGPTLDMPSQKRPAFAEGGPSLGIPLKKQKNPGVAEDGDGDPREMMVELTDAVNKLVQRLDEPIYAVRSYELEQQDDKRLAMIKTDANLIR